MLLVSYICVLVHAEDFGLFGQRKTFNVILDLFYVLVDRDIVNPRIRENVALSKNIVRIELLEYIK